MKGHLWFEFNNARRIAAFIAATAAIFVYWNCLLPGVFGHITGRRGLSLMIYLHVAWFGGWMGALFGKAQDLHASTDYDFDGLRRFVSKALISLSTLAMLVIYLFSKA